MSAADPARELLLVKGKLNALSAILRLGHEAFTKHTLKEWAIHVVNNSVLAIPYDRSSLIDLRSAMPTVLAVSGQSEVNANSEFALNLCIAARELTSLKKITLLDENLQESLPSSAAVEEAFGYFNEVSEAIYFVPLRPAGTDENADTTLLWVVEFAKKEQAVIAPALLALLSEHYAESLFYILNERKTTLVQQVMDRRKMFKPSRIFLMLLLLFALACVIVRIPQKVSAEFEIVPENASIVYSPFDGVIEKCFFRSGTLVKRGEPVLQFNTEERQFSLAAAQNDYNKTSAQLDLTQRISFRDINQRGKIKLLELQQARSDIEIKRNQWYLKRSSVLAETDGILDIGDADKMEGKAVRAGEKLFEVSSITELAAMIYLDERYSSVLQNGYSVTLYLHSRPELPIASKVISISPKPVLTERKLFCYLIKVKPDIDAAELICGMRGIARISGDRVSLGYYLFRNLLLWYRQL